MTAPVLLVAFAVALAGASALREDSMEPSPAHVSGSSGGFLVARHDWQAERAAEAALAASRDQARERHQAAQTDPVESALSWSKHIMQLEPPAPPEPEPSPEDYGTPASGLNWAALRECESGGDYSINTGNGYFGAYQFALSTWQSVGGSGYPHEASPSEQDYRAQLLYNREGASPWPVCGSLL